MSITPDQFLAQPSDPDDGEETPDLTGTFEEDAGFPYFEPTPIWKIDKVWQIPPAHELLAPLERIANALEGQGSAAVEEDRLREAFSDRNQEFDDLEAKYESLFGLVADIEKLVAKSTSKLANSVRDAINGWKTGTVVEEPSYADAPTDTVIHSIPPRPSTYIGPPAHDAPVEEWRAFASGFDLAEGIDLEQMNRSQIRSVLGMAQVEPGDNSDG